MTEEEARAHHIELHRLTHLAIESVAREVSETNRRLDEFRKVVDAYHAEALPVLNAYHATIRALQEQETQETAQAVARVRAEVAAAKLRAEAGSAARLAADEAAAKEAEAAARRLKEEADRAIEEARRNRALFWKYATAILGTAIATFATAYLALSPSTAPAPPDAEAAPVIEPSAPVAVP